jgi:hypothetical protein
MTGVDDDVVDGDVAFDVTFAAATSLDSNFHGTSVPGRSVLNTDGKLLFCGYGWVLLSESKPEEQGWLNNLIRPFWFVTVCLSFRVWLHLACVCVTVTFFKT